jgi:hypothetical protein
MNLIDNGIKEVINIERIITDTELYFLITFVDYYGTKKTKKFSDIIDLDKKHWVE